MDSVGTDRAWLANRSWLPGLAALLVLGFWLPSGLKGEDKPARLAPELAAAIRAGNLDQVGKLLDNGADVNARDNEGNTPLLLASFLAGPDCVEFLLKKKADVHATNEAGVTALIRGATDPDKVRLLLAAGAKIDVRTKALGNTPLLLAARRFGNIKAVQLLLEGGADVKASNNFGISPLMAAAASGDVETVTLLLNKGAEVNAYPSAGNPAVTSFLAGMRTPLMWAAFHDDVPLVRLLLDRKADPNQGTFHGSPLSHAAWHDSRAAAEVLLENGAKVDSRDAVADFTPLHWAAGSDSPRPDLVKLLLARGADPNAKGGDPIDAFLTVPQTPRLIAALRGRSPIVEALIAAGAKDPPAAEPFKTPARDLPETLDRKQIRAAVERAVIDLQETAAKSYQAFLRHASKQDCVSCHQQYLPMAAVGHARERAIPLDQDAAREQIALASKVTQVFFNAEMLAQTVFHPEPVNGLGYELFGFLAEKVPAGPATDARVHHLATLQAADGRWFMNMPRPPLVAGDVSGTALAVLALKNYGWPGRQKEFDRAIDRARRWLWTVKAETNEDAVFQLLGLHWAGEPADKLAELARALANRQRPDGGWAQLPTLASDAYATGQAMYALVKATNHSPTDDRWQKGVRFLLSTQFDDGSWRVARRAFPVQPTMDSGFPHQRDSWISTSGTSWAVMALTQALERGVTTAKPAPIAKPPVGGVASPKDPIDFVRQVKPLLERSCLGCHGPDKQRGGYRADSREALLKGGGTGEAAVVPGHANRSRLLDYVSGQVVGLEMPPLPTRERFAALSRDQAQLLRAWIDQGAAWPGDVKLDPSRVPAKSPSDRWEKDIQAFEAADLKAPPPEGAILFIGSSSTKLWKTLAADFPDQKVINRGFGGSQIADSVHFAERIVIPCKPRLIVLQAGSNDINAGKTPERVRDDFKAFVEVVRAKLPKTRIAFLSINPAPVRWAQAEKQKEANRLIKDYVRQGENLDYIDLWDQFLGADGQPREDLFLPDRLHNNAAGYKVRADVVRPHLGSTDKDDGKKRK